MRLLNRLASRRRVDRYWSGHLVRREPFKTAQESLDYLEWRFSEYPLFREFSGLWGDHDGEVVLDYGCGPGNDLAGFLVHTDATRVIGVDVSDTALELARQRLALHEIPESRFELIQVSDSKPEIPLDTESVDFFQCQGVLQHTSDPGSILKELHRVLKPGGEARVMVYNRDSIWLNLWTAYVVQVLQGQYADLPAERALQFTTDGPDCPIARCWRGEDFVALCREAGFDARFLGGYPSRHELEQLSEHWEDAIGDERLGREHREFLREIELDEDGYPTWRGKHAGVGGSYVLSKAQRGAS